MKKTKARRGGAVRERREMPWGDVPKAPPLHETAGGIISVNKPAGVTSHDVVGVMRRLAGTRKVGHAGTLDPMATGVLVIGIGQGTKLLTYLVGADKEYSSTFRFGVETDTEDSTGTILTASGCHSGEEDIDAALASQVGDILQVPSSFSAKKIDGQRAYALARAGETVELAANPITISELRRLGPIRAATQTLPGDSPETVNVIDVDVHLTCSSGTYVRAIARDAGKTLGCGAHMTALRRTRVGTWPVAKAYDISDLAQMVSSGQPIPLCSLAQSASAVMPCIEIDSDQADKIRVGGFVDCPQGAKFPAALISQGQLVAVAVRRGKNMGAKVVFSANLQA